MLILTLKLGVTMYKKPVETIKDCIANAHDRQKEKRYLILELKKMFRNKPSSNRDNTMEKK